MPELAGETRHTVNDDVMDAIRSDYEVMDRIIKSPQYDGKAVQAESWQAFQEIRLGRHALSLLRVGARHGLHGSAIRALLDGLGVEHPGGRGRPS